MYSALALNKTFVGASTLTEDKKAHKIHEAARCQALSSNQQMGKRKLNDVVDSIHILLNATLTYDHSHR